MITHYKVFGIFNQVILQTFLFCGLPQSFSKQNDTDQNNNNHRYEGDR